MTLCLNSKSWVAYLVVAALWLQIGIVIYLRSGSSKPYSSPLPSPTVTAKKGFYVDPPTIGSEPIHVLNDSSSTNGSNVSLSFVDLSGNLPTWKRNTFCANFVGRTFQESVPMCGGTVSPTDSLQCLRNPSSTLMATCIIENLAIHPKKLLDKMRDCERCDPCGSNSLWLLNNINCAGANGHELETTTEDADYLRKFMQEVISKERRPPSECGRWVNETVYFFVGHPYHIYFQFLAYYNLHKSILSNLVATPGNFIVLRITDAKNYRFKGYEKRLFPELITLNELPDVTICFRKVILVPWTYSSVAFRCKMEVSTRQKCLDCNGRGLYGTDFVSFRTRVLQACSLQDQSKEERAKRQHKHLVVVLRKPYTRWNGDYAHQFQRVLTNEGELVNALKRDLPSTNVSAIHMEKLDLCEQIRYAHDADVLMGVHGAGLVHLWWLQEDSLLFELVTTSMIRNPSFKTLAKLSGRRYHGQVIGGGVSQVMVDVGQVIKALKSVSVLT